MNQCAINYIIYSGIQFWKFVDMLTKKEGHFEPISGAQEKKAFIFFLPQGLLIKKIIVSFFLLTTLLQSLNSLKMSKSKSL